MCSLNFLIVIFLMKRFTEHITLSPHVSFVLLYSLLSYGRVYACMYYSECMRVFVWMWRVLDCSCLNIVFVVFFTEMYMWFILTFGPHCQHKVIYLTPAKFILYHVKVLQRLAVLYIWYFAVFGNTLRHDVVIRSKSLSETEQNGSIKIWSFS